MLSRTEKYCNAVMEAAWLCALVVAPLFINHFSYRGFNHDKLNLVRSLILLAGSAWLVKAIDGASRAGRISRQAREQGNTFLGVPLVLQTLALGAVFLVCTAVSIVPRISWWGSYQRAQGTFSILCFVLLFCLVATELRTGAQWRRLQFAVLLASLAAGVCGIMQHIGPDPIPWDAKKLQGRIPGTMGNPIFFAAYLIMAVPLALEFLIHGIQTLRQSRYRISGMLLTGSAIVILAVQLTAIFISQSRGPFLGFCAGAYVFVFLGLILRRGKGRMRPWEIAVGIAAGIALVALLGIASLGFLSIGGIAGRLILATSLLAVAGAYGFSLLTRRGARWMWLSWLTQSVVVVLLIFNLNWLPLPDAGVQNLPYVGRLLRVMDTEENTTQVRIIIWKQVADLMASKEPLHYPDGGHDPLGSVRLWLGYGPESFFLAGLQFYRPELGELDSSLPARAHNELFDRLATTGIAGVVAYLLLMGSIFYYAQHWLGLIGSPAEKRFFFFAGGSSILLGIAVPWFMGSVHFAGMAVATGLVAGMIAAAAFAAFREREEVPFDRRVMVLLVLLFAITAHFVEIQTGIATPVTRLYFFVFAGALVAVGSGRLHLQDATCSEGGAARDRTCHSAGDKRKSAAKPPVERRKATIALWQPILPYALLAGIIVLILNWDFIFEARSLRSPLHVFWTAWSAHIDVDNQSVPWVGRFFILLATLGIGLPMALTAMSAGSLRSREVSRRIFAFVGLSFLIWILFGLFLAGRMIPLAEAVQLERVASHYAGHLTSLYLWLGALLLLLVMALGREHRDAADRSAGSLLRSAVLGSLLLLGAMALIHLSNITPIQADTFFKLGKDFEAQGYRSWSSYFYQRAADAAPNEELYLLTLGQSLMAQGLESGDAAVRDSNLARAEKSLRQARDVNPWNTMTLRVLGGYYVTVGKFEQEPAARQAIMRSALACYERAEPLSPTVADLYAEWGYAYLTMGDAHRARELCRKALALNPRNKSAQELSESIEQPERENR